MDPAKKVRKFLLLLALALAGPAPVAHAASSALFAFEHLMFRRSINAVHFDGKTWLEATPAWDVPERGHTFFRSWWERSDQQTGEAIVFAAGSPYNGDILLIMEMPSAEYNADQLYVLVATVNGDDGNFASVECKVPGSQGILPRNGKWTFIQLAINTSTQECQFAVQQGATFQEGHMTYTSNGPPGPIPWWVATHWVIGASATPNNGADFYRNHMTLDYMEGYTDLRYDWDVVGGVTALIFTTESGFARNLDWQQGTPPHLRDCGEPLAGLFPAMCNRGNNNFFVNGHEVSPTHFAYTMTEHGSLQPAESDACLIRGIGDGCSGP